MTDVPELTDRQVEFIGHLPASTPEIAEAMGVEETTVESHRTALKRKGIGLEYDSDANQWYIADDRAPALRSKSTTTKQQITKQASALIEEEQAVLMRRLRRTEPVSAKPVTRDGHESMGIIIGDLHFGDVVEKEFWDDDEGEYTTTKVYSSEIAADKVETFARKVLYIKELMSSVATFDDAYVFIMGDLSTGMYIYEGQQQHIDAPLNEQVEESVSALYQMLVSFAESFETVQVRAVPGNHGTDKPTSAIGANTDLITYGWLDDRLRDSGYENVDFRAAGVHHHLNTTARGWRFHVRHGDDEMEHVDETSRSRSDWRGLRDEFKFDAAMKGHHHKPSFHKVLNHYPVFSSPSPKPGGEFASRIGSPDVSEHADLGWCFGISDDRPVTWKFLLDDMDDT